MMDGFKSFSTKAFNKFKDFSTDLKDKVPSSFEFPKFSFPKFPPAALYSIILIESILLIAAIGGGVWYYWTHLKNKPVEQKRDLPTFIVEGTAAELGNFETFI